MNEYSQKECLSKREESGHSGSIYTINNMYNDHKDRYIKEIFVIKSTRQIVKTCQENVGHRNVCKFVKHTWNSEASLIIHQHERDQWFDNEAMGSRPQ